MILSGREIEWYRNTGKLKIDPVEQDQFQQNGIDLILDDVNMTFHRVSHSYGDKCDGTGHDGCAEFEKGEFYIGCTREVLELPDDLMAFVELRSTWARKGLVVPPTIVDAGFHGNLTLEIAAFTNVRIPYGQRFAHLIFAKLTSPSLPYNGKYQNQRGVTGPIEDIVTTPVPPRRWHNKGDE